MGTAMRPTERTPAHALLGGLFDMYQHIGDTHACAVLDIRHALERQDTVCAVFEVLDAKMSDVDVLMHTLLELMHTARQTQEDGMERAAEELACARVAHWLRGAGTPLPTIYEAKQELECASRLVHETQTAYTKRCFTINAITNEIWREFYDELLCTAREALSTGSLAQGSTLERVCVLWEGLLECYNDALWHVEAALEARATHRAYMMLLNCVVLPMHAHAQYDPEKHHEAGEVGEVGEAGELGTACENDEAGELCEVDTVFAAQDHVLCLFRRWHVAAVGTKYSRRIARQRAVSCLRAWQNGTAEAAQCRRSKTSTAWHKAQAVCTMAHDRRITCCAGATQYWKEHTARARRTRQYVHERALVRSSRVLLRALVAWKHDKAVAQYVHERVLVRSSRVLLRALVAWKHDKAVAQRVHAWLERMAPERAALALLRAWQRWKHHVIAASNLRAKYGACARQLLLAASDTAFFARAAWRGRFRQRRARVATFAKLVWRQRLQLAFDIMARPVKRRKNMNEMCLRRYNRHVRGVFDVLFNLLSIKQCRILHFEMQALGEIAAVRHISTFARTLPCIQPEIPVQPLAPAPPLQAVMPGDMPATPEVAEHGLGVSPEEVVSLAIDFVLKASNGVQQGVGALAEQPLALHAVRKVLQRIQDEHGSNSVVVPSYELFWWAAITDLTVCRRPLLHWARRVATAVKGAYSPCAPTACPCRLPARTPGSRSRCLRYSAGTS